MDFVDWMHETHRLAKPLLEAALAAAAAGDREAAARTAREAAGFYLRRYLEVAKLEAGADARTSDLLELAAQRDSFFSRLRAEAERLDAGVGGDASVDDLADAMKEIRFLAVGRAENAGWGASPYRQPLPRLAQFLTHATTVERASRIFAEHALYSFSECVRRGLLSGEPIGAKYLHDPRRCAEYVGFSVVGSYHAGEKVANSQRKGFLDEGLQDDYQPSVRLFFPRAQIEGLPGFDNDGLHQFLVRDQVSLELLECAVFPSSEARDLALTAVGDAGRWARLEARCLVAPAECCGDPQRYTTGTNELVATRFGL